jgi:hypothetical protein
MSEECERLFQFSMRCIENRDSVWTAISGASDINRCRRFANHGVIAPLTARRLQSASQLLSPSRIGDFLGIFSAEPGKYRTAGEQNPGGPFPAVGDISLLSGQIASRHCHRKHSKENACGRE